MRTAQIRQQLHDYINSAEDKKLKAIYTLLEDDLPEDYQLTTSQKEELDRRNDDHMKGIGTTYSWEEAVAMAEQAFKERKG